MRHHLALVAATAVLLTACGSSDATGPATHTRVTEATAPSGGALPAPDDEVVLTVTGDIAAPNVGAELQLDMATLESLGLVEFEVDDEQAEGGRHTFRGVLLRDLLDAAGADDGATTLRAVALNDYAVDVPVADADELDALLATTVDGERMPVDRFGPVRVVYPYDALDVDATVVDPRWIWQLVEIEVR